MSDKAELFTTLPPKPLSLEQWWARAVWRPFLIFPIVSLIGLLFIVVPGIVFGFASAVGLSLYIVPACLLVKFGKKYAWTYEQRWSILYHLTWAMPLFSAIVLTIGGLFSHRIPFSAAAWDAAYPSGLLAFGIGIILTLIYLIYISRHTAALRKENLLAF